MSSKTLSKSRFQAGRQCEKRLWMEVNQRDLMVTSPLQAHLFATGLKVGELARALCPGGVLIEEDHLHMPQAIQATQKAIEKGADILYEAAAEHAGVLARADLLVRSKEDPGVWDLIEVKSSTSAKSDHVYDLALQAYVFWGAGFPIGKAYLAHIHNQYVRKGGLDVRKLFALTDLTHPVKDLLDQIPDIAKGLLKVLNQAQRPEVPIGTHCSHPYDCPFTRHCWKDVPENSVFDLGRYNQAKATQLFHQGIQTIQDLPEGLKLSATQALQTKVVKSGKPHWDLKRLSAFLEKLEYPLHFLDFEAINPAVPLWDGTRPFQRVPFQFSLHVLKAPGEKPAAFEYLHQGSDDPRKGVADSLAKALGEKGSLVSYSASYEAGVLRELAELYPKHGKVFQSAIDRMVDLIVPFRKSMVVHPGFHGSASLKAVLPVLVPGMTYEGMEIGDGAFASMEYLRMIEPPTPKAERDRIYKNLLTYCGQDTMAMVRIYETLRGQGS